MFLLCTSRSFRARLLGLGALALALGLAAPSLATPVEVGQGAFSPAATTIDFEIGDEAPITNQFAGLGVTFGGGLVGDAISLIAGAGNLHAANFLTPASCPCPPITIDFSTSMLRVGFFLATNDLDATDIRIFQSNGGGYTETAAFFYDTGLAEIFVGFEDTMGGIDRIEIDVTDAFNGALVMDLLSFEPLPAPEPGLALLLGMGLVALGARRRA